MIKNYFKIAWRNLLKGKIYSVINILGMGIGIGICLLIFLFVSDEWTYDTFHSKSDRIYRSWVKEHFKGDIFFNSITPYLLGTELADNFPEIEQMSRYLTINSLVKKNDNIEEENIHLADPSFFNMFDFNLIRGEKNVLEEMHNVVITERIALKYFNDPSPLGKTLTLQVGGNWTDFIISGIVVQAPNNSSIQYDIIIPFENTTTYMSEFGRQCWTCVSVETYVLLNKDNNIADLTQNVAPFIDRKVNDDYKAGEYIIGFQPLTDIHLNNNVPQGIVAVSDSRYPYILSGVAFLILLLACINFTTLAVGRSLSRSREVGIRKVSGAHRGQLMFQFWSEAFLTVFAGVLIGIILTRLCLPAFNQIADKQLSLDLSPGLLIGLSVIFIFTGAISGLYPALVLSGYKPIQALKGGTSTSGNIKNSILTWLVGFQFVLSVVLIICTVIMQNQMYFLQNKNLGFEKSHILSFPYDVSGEGLTKVWEDGKRIQDRLEDKLKTHSNILGTTVSSHAMGSAGWLNIGYTDKLENRFRKFNALQIDEDFLDLMEIKILEGRNFSKDIATDEKAVIVNQSMINDFDLKDPIGKFLPEPFSDWKIIGTTDNFHFSSLHNPIDPLVISYNMIPLIQTASDMSYIDPINPKFSVKVTSDNLPATIKFIRDSWKEVAPDQSFAYSFIDDDIDFLYKHEAKLSSILTISTLLAILIACMGLFGISALKIAYKTKEIGIRKVLGASATSILRWLSLDYIKLILVASVVASPLAWLAMGKWLQDFEFHVHIEWWVFALAIILIMIIALISVSVQSIRASFSNPVDSLRNE